MQLESEVSKAFMSTGALVLGGILGGGASYLAFGDFWLLNAACAVAGAWVARYLTGLE